MQPALRDANLGFAPQGEAVILLIPKTLKKFILHPEEPPQGGVSKDAGMSGGRNNHINSNSYPEN